MSELRHVPYSGGYTEQQSRRTDSTKYGGGGGKMHCLCEHLSVINGGTGVAGGQEALINVGNSHPCIT